jgi:hypothetical protein
MQYKEIVVHINKLTDIAFPNCIKYKINQKKIKRHNPEGVEYRIAPGETWGSKISKKMYLTQSGNAIINLIVNRANLRVRPY